MSRSLALLLRNSWVRWFRLDVRPLSEFIRGVPNDGLSSASSPWDNQRCTLFSQRSEFLLQRIAVLLVATGAIWQLATPLQANDLPSFSKVRVGGGGAITRVNRNGDGSKLLSGADQYGCYQRTLRTGEWTQLVRSDNFPAGAGKGKIYGEPLSPSCDEAVYDPSDAAKIWLGINGGVYKSADSGSSFSTTCYPQYVVPSQSPGHTPYAKAYSPYIAVDPFNSQVVYMSTPHAGLSRTVDGGTTCTTLTAVGSGGAIPGVSDCNGPCYGGHLIGFDPSTSTTSCAGGVPICAKNIFVSTYGRGVYKSNDGGQNWSLLNSAGMPTSHVVLKVDPFGRLWFVDESYAGGGHGLGAALSYIGSTWKAISDLSGKTANGVDFDPRNCASTGACHITFMLGGGRGSTGVGVSRDGGKSFVSTNNVTIRATGDATWVESFLNGPFGFYSTGAAYDNAGRVWTGGEGTFYATPIAANSVPATFYAQMAGIEETLSSSIATSPSTSAALVLGTWDLNCFRPVQPFDRFPDDTQRGCNSTNGAVLQHTYNVDWASASPSFFIALTDNQSRFGGYINFSGISNDNAHTWTALSLPSDVMKKGHIGGCIAASSSTNFLVAPTDGSGGNVAPFFTTDGGETWSHISVRGFTGGWPFQIYGAIKVCAADRVNPNTFYLYNWNAGDGGGDALVKCTGGGASCSIQSRPSLSPNQQYSTVLKSVPGNAGHIFLSWKGNDPTDGKSGGLRFYRDGGVKPLTVNGFANVYAFGFGAPTIGHTYPAIVVVGIYKGVYGIWQSLDWDGDKTWQQIATYPKNLLSEIKDVDGDKVIPNVFYYTGSSGTYCSAPSRSFCNGPN